MSVNTKATATLTKLQNLNNCLMQEYFGQVAHFPDKWLDMIGTISNVEHGDIKLPIQVKLLKIIPMYADELERFDQSIYINPENIPTIAELCGFNTENIKSFTRETGYRENKLIGLYIFKNLNFKQ